MNQEETVLSGELEVDGVLQNGGEQAALNTDVNMEWQGADGVNTFYGEVEVRVTGKDEVYIRVDTMDVDSIYMPFTDEFITSLQNQWWMLPSDGSETSPAEEVAARPGILHAQAEVVRVVRNRGVQKINGRNAYHYDVDLNKEKFLTFLERTAQENNKEFKAEDMMEFVNSIEGKGKLWIDTENFYLHRADWDVKLSPKDGDELSFSFSVTLSDHNVDVAISPPEGAQIFNPLLFLGGDDTSDGIPAINLQNIQDFLSDTSS
jgi:hypothetical protein